MTRSAKGKLPTSQQLFDLVRSVPQADFGVFPCPVLVFRSRPGVERVGRRGCGLPG